MTKTAPSAAANLGPNLPKPAALESPKQHLKPAVNGDTTQIQRTLDGTPMEQFSINVASNTNTPATPASLARHDTDMVQLPRRQTTDNACHTTAIKVSANQNTVNLTPISTNTAATKIYSDNVMTKNVPNMVPPAPGMVPTAPLYNPNGLVNGNTQSYIPVSAAPSCPPMNYIFNSATVNYSRTPINWARHPVWPILQSAPVPAQGSLNKDVSNEHTSIQAPRVDYDEDSLQHNRTGNTNSPSRINNTNESDIHAHNSDDVFIGAHRRRYQKYFVSNIDERSTRKGILLHFEQNGVIVHELNLFRGRNDKCYAQVIVDTKYKEKVESDTFDWPYGIYCTYWKASYKQKDRRNR